MEHIGGYASKLTTTLSFDDTIEKVTELLKTEGFGILTTIDVKATMKKKLDIDGKPYTILGACNPPYAHKALEAEPLIGVMLPCNVVVWDEGDHRVVAALDASLIARTVDLPGVAEMADEVNGKMRRALSGLE